jgi:hypothetical protein
MGRQALAAGGTVLKTIRADEVVHCGKALEVRYRADPGEPGLLVVDLAACETEGEVTDVRRSEMVLLVTGCRMTRESLRERVEVEAARRAIERVCWIEEDRAEGTR